MERWPLPDDTVDDAVKEMFRDDPTYPGEDAESSENETGDSPERTDGRQEGTQKGTGKDLKGSKGKGKG